MREWLAACAVVALLGTGAGICQDPLSEANAAYRQGEFQKAAELFQQAAEAETRPTARAEIRVKLAWTLFALKNRSRAEDALAAALGDEPTLELVPDYYSDDFLALFSRVKTRLASPPPASGGGPSPLTRTSPASASNMLRQKLAQAIDPAAIESLLAEARQLEATSPPSAHPELLELRAEILDRLGRTEEALESQGKAAALRAAAQAPPGVSAVPLDTMLEGRRLVADGRPLDAAALMRGVLSAQPACAPALEVLGEAYMAAGRLDDAYNALRTTLLDSEKPDVLLQLGEIDVRRGRLAGAKDSFRRVVEKDPANDRGLAALGLLAARMEDTAVAREMLERALQANGTLFEARVVRAQLALQEKDPSTAILHLRRALQVRPDDPWATAWLGVALLTSGDAAGAEEKLRSTPSEPRSLFALALVEALRRQGKLEEALAVPLDRDDPQSAILLAHCYLDRSDPAKAESLLLPVVEKNAQDGRARYLLGVAYHAQKRWQEASRTFASAAGLRSAPPPARDAAAFAQATAEAQALLDAALTPPQPVNPQ